MVEQRRPGFSEAQVSSQERPLFRGPNVIFDSSLSAPDVSYVIKVDQQGCARFLNSLGLGKDFINNCTVKILRKPEGDYKLGGKYRYKERSIFIYTDSVYQSYVTVLKSAKRLAEHKRNFPSDPSPQCILYTSRLNEYLSLSADPERSFKFARKLLDNAFNRAMTGVFMHEAQHAKDVKNIWNAIEYEAFNVLIESLVPGEIAFATLLFLSGGHPEGIQRASLLAVVEMSIINALIVNRLTSKFIPFLAHLYNPFENWARKTAKRYENNPEFRDLITIEPKEKSQI